MSIPIDLGLNPPNPNLPSPLSSPPNPPQSNLPAPDPAMSNISECGAKLDDYYSDRATSSTWLAHFRNHFRLNKARYTTGEEQVLLFLIKGPIAGKWVERRMKEYDAD